MIISAEGIDPDETIDADLCIVGAGPAGLTIASQLIGTHHRVYLLESGSEHLDSNARDLADGEVTGHPYFPLSESRGRVVGGSAQMWEEYMRARPLDDIDFEKRSWVTASGWPFGPETLDTHYRTAQKFLGLGPYDYREPLHHESRLIPDQASGMTVAQFHYSNTFDFEHVRRQIDASANVCLVENATVLELEPNDDGTRVTRAIASMANPHRFAVSSRVFVLAAGGIDTPRILLVSRHRSDQGLANSTGLVGKHFMEHPTLRRGVIAPSTEVDDTDVDFYRQRPAQRHAVRGALVPTTNTMRTHEILNGMILISETDSVRSSEAFRSLAMVKDALRGENRSGESTRGHLLGLLRDPLGVARAMLGRRGSQRQRRLQMSATVEQAPSETSRVTLGPRLDHFGLPLPSLHWSLGEQERRTIRVMQEAIDTWLKRAGLGWVEGLLGDEPAPRVFRGEWHQLGTTRMADSSRHGVVDRDCKTHDLDNLYIAGGSVFPTVGYANPTLTIVALALRLASELKATLSRRASLGPIW